MKKVAKGLRHLELPLEWILTSPYRRAYDTAEIVAKELKRKKNLSITRTLGSEGDPKALIRYISQKFRSWESIMLVGHEPYLSGLIGALTSPTSKIGLTLEKGGCAKLTADSLTFGPCATLEWLLTPKILKKLV